MDACPTEGVLFRHDDVIKWKHFPRYWPFVWGIHRSPVNSPHKGQWRGALMFFFEMCLNKRLRKQPWGWWFETPSCPLWCHCNGGGNEGGHLAEHGQRIIKPGESHSECRPISLRLIRWMLWCKICRNLKSVMYRWIKRQQTDRGMSRGMDGQGHSYVPL